VSSSSSTTRCSLPSKYLPSGLTVSHALVRTSSGASVQWRRSSTSVNSGGCTNEAPSFSFGLPASPARTAASICCTADVTVRTCRGLGPN
jgi:hypothetical protein